MSTPQWRHLAARANIQGELRHNTWRSVWEHFVDTLLRRPTKREVTFEMWLRGEGQPHAKASMDGVPLDSVTFVNGERVDE
jgi:hypothetical protein